MRLITLFLGGALLIGCLATSQAQQQYLVWDLDLNHNSGPVIDATLQGLGYDGDYTTDLSSYFGNFPIPGAIFVCLGIYSDNEWLGAYPAEVDSLVSYITNNDSTNIYMEGGDTWYFDPPTALHPYFNIQGVADGAADAGPILGQGGTFTQGMSFTYSGDNNSIDHLAPLSTAWVIFTNGSPVYDNGIAYDNGGVSYRTIGVSFEFGGLDDGAAPSTKAVLGDSIMHFFRIFPPTFAWDVTVASIDVPQDYILPNVLINPQATVRNLGTNAATFPVTCEIDSSSGQNIYTDTQNVSGLGPGLSQQVQFAGWMPNGEGNVYDVCVYTNLGTDQRRSNDTLCKQTTVFDMSWVVNSPFSTNVPTLDGVIQGPEWQDATRRDVTDILGRGGGPFPPGQAYLYVKNDSNTVYLAMDAVMDTVEHDLDAFLQSFEDNHSGSWPAWPDSSEGDLGFYSVSSNPIFTFTPRFSDSASIPHQVSPTGDLGTVSGNMQYEYALPLGAADEELTASVGDTVGFGVTISDEGPQIIFGWWPTNTVNPSDPATMGDLVLGAPGMWHDCGVVSIDVPPATVYTGYTYDPEATVENFGNATETFDVSCVIDGYGDTVQVAGLGPGLQASPVFAAWQVPWTDSTTYTIEVRTLLAGDMVPQNNAMSMQIFAYNPRDVGADTILSPPGVVVIGGTYDVIVQVTNHGEITDDFTVHCQIGAVYTDQATVTGLTAGNSVPCTLSDWAGVTAGPFTATAWTERANDRNPANDTTYKNITTGVEEFTRLPAPTVFALSQPRPNPFAVTANIRYQIPAESEVTLSVYDLGGRLVRTLVDEAQKPGYYSVIWDGKDNLGRELASGVYFYRMEASDFTQTRKLTVLR